MSLGDEGRVPLESLGERRVPPFPLPEEGMCLTFPPHGLPRDAWHAPSAPAPTSTLLWTTSKSPLAPHGM